LKDVILNSGGYFGLFTAVVSYYLGKKQLPIGYGMISATTGISLTAGMPLAGNEFHSRLQFVD
jgi:hypothetical protein